MKSETTSCVIITGGLSVALIGAAVGAGIATAAIAVSDYQSGNVRSLGDAAFGIAGGALFGGVAGAAIAAAPFAAEFYTPLINAQLAVWGMTGASVGTGLVTAGFVGITGVNAAFTANNIVAMNSGYDFLGSTIFRNHPDIYMGAQMVTAFASMNILEAGLIVASSTNQQTEQPQQAASTASVSKGVLKHINNRHNPNVYANQLKYKPQESVLGELNRTTFFNATWSTDQIENAINTGYNAALAAGELNGQYVFTYDGDIVTIVLLNGDVQTAFGDYVYSYDFLYDLIQ